MNASKLEVLLAIASSEFHQTTHVHYMPIGKEFTGMLRTLRGLGFVEPLHENYYKVTRKGWDYIRRQNKLHFEDTFKAIDEFVDGLK